MMNHHLSPLLAGLLCSLAPAQVEDLGAPPGWDTVLAQLLSRDGSIAVGVMSDSSLSSAPVSYAVRWSDAPTPQILGNMGRERSRGIAMSDDGQFIAGILDESTGVRWDGAGNVELLQPSATGTVMPFAISGDGQTIVGELAPEGAEARAFVWTATAGMLEIAPLPGFEASRARRVSRDGSVVVGEMIDAASFEFPFFWTEATGAVVIASPSADWMTVAALTRDGSEVVGVGHTAGVAQVFKQNLMSGAETPIGPVQTTSLRVFANDDASTVYFQRTSPVDTSVSVWTETDGFDFDPTGVPVSPWAVASADGSTLMGQAFKVGTGFRHMRWRASTGVVWLDTPLEMGSLVLGISSDGGAALASWRNALNHHRAIRFRDDGSIGRQYCSGNPNSVSASGAKLSLSGSNMVDQHELELRIDDLPLQTFGFFLVARTSGLVLQHGGSQGNLCLSGGIGYYSSPKAVQNSGATGEIRLTIDPAIIASPGGPVAPSYGETFYFQGWYRDANPTSTSNFTSAASVQLY